MTREKSSSLPRAVVICLESFIGLQTARILTGHSVPVIGIADRPDRDCCKTNTCEKMIFANTSNVEFIQALQDLGPTLDQKAVLFPCTDLSVLLVSQNRQKLEPWYHIMLPDPDVVEMLMSKTLFVPFAQKAGLAVPKTFLLHNREDARRAAETLSFPSILKPPVKTPKWVKCSNGAKVYQVASAEELLALYDRCCEWTDELMVQEWVEGPETSLYSCNCYFNRDSEPLVTFIARKIRQWPPITGISCLSEECRNDTVLQESLRLFKSVNYCGLGYVEMKRDERTGKHVIIEPNIGRPTGRSAITEAGGVELVYTAYCDAAGLPLPENRTQQYGNAKWIYWRRDIQSALYYWRRGELTLQDWQKSLRGKKRCALFSWADPKPFWSDLARVARRQTRALFRRQKPEQS